MLLSTLQCTAQPYHQGSALSVSMAQVEEPRLCQSQSQSQAQVQAQAQAEVVGNMMLGASLTA